MAALLAAAAETLPAVAMVNLESEGVILVYGADERAVEAGILLKDHLDVTVLLKPPAAIAPARSTEFPIVRGTIRGAKGHVGGFELTVDDFALPAPSSRGTLVFEQSRNGAKSQCDIILDISGGAALFPAADLRDGYLRADPNDPAAILKAVLQARDLVGTFEKPRYITFDDELCAHSRSRIVGCNRCLDLCPTGAITPAGNHVTIDAQICAGCGQCAAVCPTGAASYALPPADALMRKLRTLLTTYREAGGKHPVVLLHDEAHGGALIDALARHGEGLPANALPLAVNEVTQVGLETIAAAFAYGAMAVRFLLRAKPRHDVAGLAQTIALAEPILAGLGFGTNRVATIETDDPEALGAALRAIAEMRSTVRPANFLPVGAKRSVLRFALRELQLAAPEPVDVIALPPRAPFGSVEVRVAGCTLCLACVSACPTGALTDDPERPVLRFADALAAEQLGHLRLELLDLDLAARVSLAQDRLGRERRVAVAHERGGEVALALAWLLDVVEQPAPAAPDEDPVLASALGLVERAGDERTAVGVEDRLDHRQVEQHDHAILAAGLAAALVALLVADEVEVLDQRVLELVDPVLVDQPLDAQPLARVELVGHEGRAERRIALDPRALHGEEHVAHPPADRLGGPAPV